MGAPTEDAEANLTTETRAASPEVQLPPRSARLERGARISRYTIIEPLGRGGMGDVYAAYDPKLDRRIALKVIRADRRAKHEANARMLREAQAIARLSHPNVIAVYDVGTLVDGVFIAMEYVPGRNLRQWLKEETPEWSRVIEVMRQAGRGLAAAHAAGLVHRDFKPANVIVGDDGRTRVLDFGLARAPHREGEPVPEHRDPDLTPDFDPLQTPVTQAGAMVGTPLYMAPEQYEHRADERSDQYSFCVVLYEGLYGVRPFAKQSVGKLRELVLAGESAPPPRDNSVPSRYQAIIERGMSVAPDNRYPSMQALLADLGRSRRRLWLSVAAGLVVAAVAGGLIVSSFADTSREVCPSATDRLSGVWDDARRAEMQRAFTATDVRYADTAFVNAAAALDRYADEWLAMRRDTCRATEVHHEQSEQLLDLRMLCLDRRLHELGALSAQLASADAPVVEKAVQAAGGLTALARCADTRALVDRVQLPADAATQQRIAETREHLAEASALLASGRYERAHTAIDPIVTAARAIDYAPLVAEVLIVEGQILLKEGDAKAAATTLLDSFLAALAARDDHAAVSAATTLVFAVGYRLGRHDEGDTWARTAKALLDRGRSDAALDSDVEINLAMIRTLQGRYDDAEAHARRCLELRIAAHGDDARRTGAAHHTLALILKKRGHYELALAEYHKSLDIHRAALGDAHPNVAMSLHNIGVVRKRLGDLEGARDTLTGALERWEISLPAGHPNIGMALLNLGAVETRLGNLAAAAQHLERARQIKAESLGADHWSLATVDLALAEVHEAEGRFDRALELVERALERLKTELGGDHPEIVSALGIVGRVRLALGDVDSARAAYRRGLAMGERLDADDHPSSAKLRLGLARVALADGEPRAAVAAIDRALVVFEANDEHPAELADARFLLARALSGDPKRGGEADALAQQALAGYRSTGHNGAGVAEVEQWLAGRSKDTQR